MNNDTLGRMLNNAKHQESLERNHTPEEVKSKLDDIYQAIERGQSAQEIREALPSSINMQQTTEKMIPSPVRTRNNKLRRYSTTVAAALMISIGGIIGSGYISSDMARLIKQIPGTNEIYQFTSTFGWIPADEQKSPELQSSITQEGVTITLRSLVYDGKKIYVHLEQKSNTQLFDYQAVNLSINGQPLTSSTDIDANLQWSENTDKNISYLSLQKELTSDILLKQSGSVGNNNLSDSDLPQALDIKVDVQLQDMQNHPFIFNVYVKRDIPQMYQLKNITKNKEGITYDRATVTATSGSTNIELQLSGVEKWRYDYYLKYGHYPASIDYILIDSMNNVYRTQSRKGDLSKETLEYDAISKENHEITLIPWTFNEEPIMKNRVVSNSNNRYPLMIDMGQTGKVNLLNIDSTPEHYVLHIQPEKTYQSYMVAYSLWYGQLDQDRHETYPSEVMPDPEHKGQFLVYFDKNKLKTNDQLYYSINKMKYLEPMRIQRTDK